MNRKSQQVSSRSCLWLISLLFVMVTASAEPVSSVAITTVVTDQKHPGKFVWADLLTTDPATAARFYTQVFDWQADYIDEDYLMLSSNGIRLGGISKNQAQHSESNQWISFISASDMDKTHKYLIEAGAEVVIAPTMMEGRGDIAIYVAPDAALFGVINSVTGDPEEIGPQVGQWVWVELWSTDTKVAAEFYDDLGYEVVDNWISDNDKDLLLLVGDIARAGLIQGHESQTKSVWIPYVLVESVEETLSKVASANGKSHEIKGEGKANIVLIRDPTGGLLAIYEVPDEATDEAPDQGRDEPQQEHGS
jgi:predicted enzyme related to lactoylglutathione lyase